MSVLSSTYSELAAKYNRTVVSTNKSKSTSVVSNKDSRELKSVSLSDELQLSPQVALKGVIGEFKQSKASNLTIDLTVKSSSSFSSADTQQKIMNSADKLLKMVSKDDEEYNQLKSSFENMFKKASAEFDDVPMEEEIKAAVGRVDVQQGYKELKVSRGVLSGTTVKYSSYKITMNFSNSENSEASESKSIANSFADALASFFGYKKETPEDSSSNKEDVYAPTNSREAKAMRNAQIIDAFSSSSNSSVRSLAASLKKNYTSKNGNPDVSLRNFSNAVDSSSVSVRASSTEKSGSVSANLSESYQRLQELRLKGCDPIVLDLSGEGITLTEAGKGGKFDINADGVMDSTGWVSGNTAMLVYDKNGNNIIDDGRELFGDQNGASDGFAELAKYDENGDGKIDSKDSIYKKLKLYRDLNGDGLMSENEFNTLDGMGIKSLKLDARAVDENVNGNSIVLSGSFEREDGSSGRMADAIFGYKDL